MATLYCKVSGIALIALPAVCYLGLMGPMDMTGTVFHGVIGIAAAIIGFGKGDLAKWAQPYTKVFGIVFLALGVIGFVMPNLLSMFQFDMVQHVAHLALGAYGVYAGYLAERQHQATAAA